MGTIEPSNYPNTEDTSASHKEKPLPTRRQKRKIIPKKPVQIGSYKRH